MSIAPLGEGGYARRLFRARLGAAEMGWASFADLAVAAGIALWHFTPIRDRDRSRDGCFRAFRLNHWIGFAGTSLAFAVA